VNRVGGIFRKLGIIGMTIGAGISVYRIYSSPACERGRVFSEELGGWGGAIVGGLAGAKIGAMLGAVGGPFGSMVGAFIGGAIGGIVGYNYGSQIGGSAHDSIIGPPKCDCYQSQ